MPRHNTKKKKDLERRCYQKIEEYLENNLQVTCLLSRVRTLETKIALCIRVDDKINFTFENTGPDFNARLELI